MSAISEAEQFLLTQIREGDNQAWSQLVNRYQGRLISFAQARLPQRADCEDLVQDTFIAFLRSLKQFRADCSLETYLFSMLRRKIIDSYRRRASSHICLLQDVYDSQTEDKPSDAFDGFIAPDPSVSWYMRRDEQAERQRALLSGALSGLVNGYKKALDFTNLQIVELLFYGQLSNGDTARVLNLPTNRIGVTKHRALKQIQEAITGSDLASSDPDSDEFENMLVQVWQSLRPSCPKRSTVGGYLLQTLDENWQHYVDFHLNQLGCHFCRANLEDLKEQNKDNSHPRALHTRIMQSTVGFLHKP